MNDKSNWLKNPTLTIFLTCLIIWLVGTMFSFLAMTNLLTQSPFQKNHLMQWILVISSTSVLIIVAKNYLFLSRLKNK